MTVEKKEPQPLVEVPVILRLTPEAHAALVKEAQAAELTIDEKTSVILEVRLVDRDPVEEFQAALERAGTSGEEFSQAWRRGQEAERRDSVPLKKGTDDA